MSSDKPAYEVPSMATVRRKAGTNGYKMVSTFSGAGGSCIGMKLAGFDVRWASEFVPSAQDTYRANHTDTHLDTRDIREVTADDILNDIGMRPGELDLFEGSPPCASFSMAGKREKYWGETKRYSDVEQRTDDLFYEYARLVRGLQPRTFVAENVAGLVQGSAKGYFKAILRELRSCGYRVEAKVLDAKLMGVPQTRNRLFFFGVREDLGVDPVWPKPLPYSYSMGDVLPNVEQVWAKTDFDRTPDDRDYISRVPLAKSAGAVMASAGVFGTASYGVIHRDPVSEEDATPSIPSVANAWHRLYPNRLDTPVQKFSISELKLLQSFPADMVLHGDYYHQAERIGRSVPPLMMAKVGDGVRQVLDACAE